MESRIFDCCDRGNHGFLNRCVDQDNRRFFNRCGDSGNRDSFNKCGDNNCELLNCVGNTSS